MEWISVKDKPLPESQIIIGISSFRGETCDWLTIGKKISENAIESTVGVLVHPIIYWHSIPELPINENGMWLSNDKWIKCNEHTPPSYNDGSIEFILFDEHCGIAEAYYWGSYQSDTWSCKHYFNKPLFWRPFPILPIRSFDVLQIN